MALVVIMPMLLGNLTVQSLRTVSKSPRYFFIALLGFSLFCSKAPLLSNFQQIRSSFYKIALPQFFFRFISRKMLQISTLSKLFFANVKNSY